MYNLGKVKGVVADGIEHKVLELVDDRQQLFSQRGHGRECMNVFKEP